MKLSRARRAEQSRAARDIAHTYLRCTGRSAALPAAAAAAGFTAERRDAALLTAFGFEERGPEHQTGMEEKKECRESEPGVQTESLSLILRGEREEASPTSGASARLAAGKHGRARSQSSNTPESRSAGSPP